MFLLFFCLVRKTENKNKGSRTAALSYIRRAYLFPDNSDSD